VYSADTIDYIQSRVQLGAADVVAFFLIVLT